MIRPILIVSIWLIHIVDWYLASRLVHLETNPLANLLPFGMYGLLILKLGFVSVVTYFIVKNKHKTDSHLFYFSATLTLIIFLGLFGVFSGIYGGMLYTEAEGDYVEESNEQLIEERGYEATQEEVISFKEELKEAVGIKVDEVYMPYYIKIIWIFGILPYFFALFSFWLFKRMIPSAKLKERKIIK